MNGKLSFRCQILLDTRESTLEKTLYKVRNVAKPLARNQTLLLMKKSILERNPMNVVNVGKPSAKSKLYYTSKSSHWRETYDCNECGKASLWNCFPLLHLRSHTGKSLMNVINVGKPSHAHCLIYIWEVTGEKPHVCKMQWESFLSKELPLLYTWEVIQVRNLMNVTNVEKAFSQSSSLTIHIMRSYRWETLSTVVNVEKLFPKSHLLHFICGETYRWEALSL